MLLVVNSGSSSVKLALFEGLTETARAQVAEIAPGGHADALAQGLAQAGVEVAALTSAAHRVVHGGAGLTQTCRVTPDVLAAIRACVPLAPLHNPANLTGISALADLAPDLPQYAAFDTAFHATNPEVAVTYALPLADRQSGMRRYGFHGLNYAAIVRIVQSEAGFGRSDRLLVFHLGNGASACAIVHGRSAATTMGYSPLDGLTMGTRSGAIDGNAVLALAARHGIDGAARILNRESGLLALGGASDMRALYRAKTPEARFAVDHFCYWAIRHAGSLVAAMGGLDAVVFTGGIGENDPVVRGRILDGLGYLGAVVDAPANRQNARHLHDASSAVAIWTVPADEERQIAIEVAHVMAEEGKR
jgi:acetate kinase